MIFLNFYLLQTTHSCLQLPVLIHTTREKRRDITRNQRDAPWRLNVPFLFETYSRFADLTMIFPNLLPPENNSRWYSNNCLDPHNQEHAVRYPSQSTQTTSTLNSNVRNRQYTCWVDALNDRLPPLPSPQSNSILAWSACLRTNNEATLVKYPSQSIPRTLSCKRTTCLARKLIIVRLENDPAALLSPKNN